MHTQTLQRPLTTVPHKEWTKTPASTELHTSIVELYYFSIPAYSFGTVYEYNNPVYSDKYGLILLGYADVDGYAINMSSFREQTPSNLYLLLFTNNYGKKLNVRLTINRNGARKYSHYEFDI